MYEFSLPMPLQKENINKIININKKINLSKISSLYFALPSNCDEFTGFEMSRFYSIPKIDFKYWSTLMEYSLEKGFNFIYLLNSPYNNNLKNLEKIDKLINNLMKLGIKKIRVTNSLLIEYLSINYPDLSLCVSTSTEYQNIKQYFNLFTMSKNIKEFVPAFDLNKNFKFLRNIHKKFPEIEIELMVNEGCMAGCPARIYHSIYANIIEKELYHPFFTDVSLLKKCMNYVRYNFYLYLAMNNIIYPWEIKDYAKIGINKFKLVGRNSHLFATGEYLDYYYLYLKGIDDINFINNIPIRYFNHYLVRNKNINLTVNDIKNKIPNIKYFKRAGHLCASRCGVECKYCYKCAEKIQKVYEKKMQDYKHQAVQACKIT